MCQLYLNLKKIERKFAFPLRFFSVQALNKLDIACSHWPRQILFTQSTDSNVILFLKYLHKITQKQCFTSHLGTP